MGQDPDAQGSGNEKRDLFGAGRNQSQKQAGVRKTENLIEGRSKVRVSEYTEQGRSWEVKNTLNM